METRHFLTAKEAAEELGVSLPTLYAYASRGLIRSEVLGASKRQRRYHLEDVYKLKERKEHRRNPSKTVEQALHWGMPVLESKITLINPDGFFYRGHDVLTLSEKHTFEEVAGLLWTGDLDVSSDELKPHIDPETFDPIIKEFLKGKRVTPVEAFLLALPLAAAKDPAAYDFRPSMVVKTGARILGLLTTIISLDPDRGEAGQAAPVAKTLQQNWAPNRPEVTNLFNAALILCADHELNTSSFTARCTASARSTPYAVVTAGLAALQGTRHGGHIRRVQALLEEIGEPEKTPKVLANRLSRGARIPGFGHRLYPQGDPRFKKLFELLQAIFPKSDAIKLGEAVKVEVFRLIGEHPTIDFGLMLLCLALDLTQEEALALFALGRSAGWIAHAIEQYEVDGLIRPRARYVGPLPG